MNSLLFTNALRRSGFPRIAPATRTRRVFPQENPTWRHGHYGSAAFRLPFSFGVRWKSEDTALDKNQDSSYQQLIFRPLENDENNSDSGIVGDGAIALLQLNRPKAANAMGSVMLKELQNVLTVLHQPPQKTACLVLSSTSSKVFSAGADLKERQSMSMEEAEAFVSGLRRTFFQFSQLPMPVVVAIEGIALGGGLELAMAAGDIVVASSHAVMGLPETSLAIIPGAGGTQFLTRRVGIARAKDLIFQARRISAQEALDYGVVDYVATTTVTNDESGSKVEEPQSALDKALEIAGQIARNGPVALQAAKLAIEQGAECASLEEALEVEKKCYAKVLPTSDRLEGLAAFREGRRPVYRGN